MNPSYEIIVHGNSLRLKEGFLGLANVTLIRSSEGPILVDTGGYVTRHALLKGLERSGLKPAEIKIVFLSHLHFDHCHNIDLFPRAKVLVSKREWDYARTPHVDDLFVPWGIHQLLESYDLELIAGTGEIDDRINYFPAPGHTPGSTALLLDTEDRAGAI